MPKSPVTQQSLFFIDKKGDRSKTDHIIQKPVIFTDLSAKQESIEEVVSKKQKKVIVISSNLSSENDEIDTEEETILFKGHISSLSSSSCEEDCDDDSNGACSDEYFITDDEDDSSADIDYIRNLEGNGEDYMLEDLRRMKLDAFDSDVEGSASSSLANDDDFAMVAKERSFLLKSPSTLMEFSLDETAAEFLSQKNRPKKGKKGKAKYQPTSKESPTLLVDPFDYDGPYTVGAINFRQINRELKAFVNDDVMEELEMDPMPPLPRKFLHELAHMYGLKSKSSGSGRDRHCVLFKNERSCIPRNVNSVKQLIDKADKAVLWMDKSVTKGKKFTKAAVPKDVKETRVRGGKVKARGGPKPTKPSKQDDSALTKPAVGTVIGQHARPIAEDNVGNRLLQKLGWKPGEGLGSASDGMVNPVDAVVRGKRTGLGHSHGT